MKRIALALGILVTATAFAQKHQHTQNFDFPIVPVTHNTLSKADAEDAQPFLLDGVSLSQTETKQSISAKHIHYRVTYRERIVVNAFYVEHVYEYKTIRSYALPNAAPTNETLADAYLMNESAQLVPCKTDTSINSLGVEVVHYLSEEGDYKIEQGVYHGRANATGYVFLPDPITTANEANAGDYSDNGDNTNAALDAERVQVNLDVTETAGLYTLENDYVRITEHSPPTIAPATSTTGEFLFNRSESGFEDVNILYHITDFQEYVQQLGFMSLGNYPLACDAHGFNGMDQSAFQWSPEQLTFGDGGVDDGEDADVIIHEYGHALSYAASPQSNFGDERRALDEAIGDYLAVSYSRFHEEFEWFKVFNWDGHNEFWPGRLAFTDAKYPINLQNDLYEDAPLWSASIMQVEENLGRDITHKILFESMFSWFSNMTMTDAAQLFIQADSQLNSGANYAYIGHIFLDRGFIDTVNAPKPNDLILSIEEQVKAKQLFQAIENPFEISKGLRIECSAAGSVEVYNTTGMLIYTGEVEIGMNTVKLNTKPGLHIIRYLTNNGNTESIKAIATP